MSLHMPILAISTSSGQTRLWDGPAERSLMSASCWAHGYRPVSHSPGNLPEPDSGHTASPSNARRTMWGPTTQPAPATISPARKNSGAPIRWKVPTAFRLATTHPVTPVRFVQIQKVVAEIADKQRRSKPLTPELRVTAAETDPTAQPETVR